MKYDYACTKGSSEWVRVTEMKVSSKVLSDLSEEYTTINIDLFL